VDHPARQGDQGIWLVLCRRYASVRKRRIF